MTKANLVQEISRQTGIIRKDVAIVVDSFLEAIKQNLERGRHIEIRGFGTFKNKERKKRIGRNPKTGIEVSIPSRMVPSFKFSKYLKDGVAQKSKNL